MSPAQEIIERSRQLIAIAPKTTALFVVSLSVIMNNPIEVEVNIFSAIYTLPVSTIFAILIIFDTVLGAILPNNYILGKEPEAMLPKPLP